MAAVLGKTLTGGLSCDCGTNNEEEIVYWDTPRRGLLQSSFALFYIVVISLNSVAIGAGIICQFYLHDHHHQQQLSNRVQYMDGWYICNVIFGILHILAAFYLVRKIEELSPEAEEDDDQHNRFVAAEMIGAAVAEPPPPSQTIVPQDKTQQATPYNPASVNSHHATAVSQGQQQGQQGQPTSSTGYCPTPNNNNNNNDLDRHPPTEPESFARVKLILCQSKVFAVYILVFAFYVFWHKFFDLPTWNQLMLIVTRCADIFIVAGPVSFALCVIRCMINRHEL